MVETSTYAKHVQYIKEWQDKKSYQNMMGEFNWNATPLALLRIKGAFFFQVDNCNTFVLHCSTENVFAEYPTITAYVLEFYISATIWYRCSRTYQLCSTHCRMLAILEANRILEAAANLIENETIIALVSKGNTSWIKTIKES